MPLQRSTPFKARIDMTALAHAWAFMLAEQARRADMAVTGGRIPEMDDMCARCEFELGIDNATHTFAYLVTEETTRRVKESKRRTILKEKTRRVYLIVHWCPRHQCEVQPLSAGKYIPETFNSFQPFYSEFRAEHNRSLALR